MRPSLRGRRVKDNMTAVDDFLNRVDQMIRVSMDPPPDTGMCVRSLATQGSVGGQCRCHHPESCLKYKWPQDHFQSVYHRDNLAAASFAASPRKKARNPLEPETSATGHSRPNNLQPTCVLTQQSPRGVHGAVSCPFRRTDPVLGFRAIGKGVVQEML